MKLNPWAWIYDVKFRKNRIALTFLGMEVVAIPVRQIQSIVRLKGWAGWLQMQVSMGWVNRCPKKYVLIEKSGGLARFIVISPENPEQFIQQVEEAKNRTERQLEE